MKAPIKVLEVLEATAGGTRKHLISLLRGIDRDVFEVEVAGPPVRDGHEKDTRFAEEVAALDVPLHAVAMHRSVRPLADLRGTLQLTKLMRRGRYDVVHLHSSKAGFLGRVAAKLNGIPTVYTPNGFYFLNARGRLTRLFFLFAERLASLLTDRMIAVSESERDSSLEARAMPARKIQVIPNAIDGREVARDDAARRRIREELGVGPQTLVVGTVSRFIAQKDPVAMIRAMRLVLDEEPEVCFVWCGEGGDLHDETRRVARELDVEQSTHFLGFRHDGQDVMNAFDVFALSSIFEGLPYALLEAMFLELPVVATDVVGSRDIVVDGETGLLVPPRQPEAMARGILALLRDPARRAALARNAKDLVEQRYGIDRMVAEIEELYRSLVR